MKQFGKILKFELKGYFTNKVFLGVTIALMLVIAVVMFFPRLREAFAGGGDGGDAEELPGMLIKADAQHADAAREAFSAAFTGYEVSLTGEGVDAIKERIVAGEAECAFVLDGLTSYTYYVDNLSMYDSNTAVADEVLLGIYRMSAMVEGGLAPEDAQGILTMQIEHETESLGKDQMQNFFYTYIMIFALYMVILLYGQMVATNVATEKSSRAMELLVTSAKPVSMMFGKVLASCTAGLVQLIAVFGTSFACYNLNSAYWESGGIVSSIFDMPLDLLGYMLVFFVLGFLMYAFLFGAVGSTASKLEDINTSSQPVTLLFIAGFFVVIFSMVDGNVDNTLMRVCSYIPFTSPMAMFTRIAMSTPPAWETAVSIAVLVVSVAAVGVVSAKIYRVGVLLYGTPPKIGAIIKAIRQA